jgi:hypothetical protein
VAKRTTLIVKTGLPRAKLQGKMSPLRSDLQRAVREVLAQHGIETETVEVFTNDALLFGLTSRGLARRLKSS